MQSEEERKAKRRAHNRRGIARWRKVRQEMGLIPLHNMYIKPEHQRMYLAVHRWSQDDNKTFQSLINEMMALQSQLQKKIV